MSAPFLPGAALHALAVFFVLLVALVADAEGRQHHVDFCPPFSCGHLRDVSSPFRQQGDPPGCGVQSYELVCTGAKATIRIGSGTYNVVSINYTDSTFWIVQPKWGIQSSCLLPRWDPYASDGFIDWSHHTIDLEPYTSTLVTFVNCSQPVENNGVYKAVACLSTNSSFIYVLTGTDCGYGSYSACNFEPSCGYLAMTPLGGPGMMVPNNASYPDVVKFMRKGFALQFPLTLATTSRVCFEELTHEFRAVPRTGIKDWILDILFTDFYFWLCIAQQLRPTSDGVISKLISILLGTIAAALWLLKSMLGTLVSYTNIILTISFYILSLTQSYSSAVSQIYELVSFYAVLCRFVLGPVAIFAFLAHKYWKTRIAIDAVEKFLRMQLMLGGPLRFAYTDLTAITSHFRERLGQGGYGCVYKGVLLPGEVQVAVKMLSNSKCNGEEFISEVSTIGRIHHVNVVCLVGFCSEEMRRALIYEYMPNGSLDKYIFSLEKSFSWGKLNEIALGIARGINYLHQGCDMQIVHFDIKPHNILLDNNFVPKVADFGLAKLCPRDNNFVPLSAMRGTIGYIAPEMVSRSFGVISSKSDVYSFGMLLLEMTGGRRNADPNASSSGHAYYPSMVYSKLSQEDVGEMGEGVDMHELEKKLCIVGLWCIQMKPHDRPTMSEVIEMLEAGVDGLQIPQRPFFCDEEVEGSYYMPSELNAIQEEGE